MCVIDTCILKLCTDIRLTKTMQPVVSGTRKKLFASPSTDEQCKIIKYRRNYKNVIFIHNADVLKKHYLYFIHFSERKCFG